MNFYIKNVEKILRREATQMERKFWKAVRNRNFLNLKFVRQHPINYQYDGKDRFFVADFYCAAHKIAIEIDGLIHNDQAESDAERTQIILSTGIEIIRFKNRDVAHDLKNSLIKLSVLIKQRNFQQ